MRKETIPSSQLKLPEYLELTSEDLNSIADVMFLALRSEYVFEESTGQYLSEKDVTLEEVAKTEEKLQKFYQSGQYDNREFDQLEETRYKLVLKVFKDRYGLPSSHVDYADELNSLSQIGDSLGWEVALEEVNKRYPNRLALEAEKRGRHWRRAHVFHTVKDYAEVLYRSITSVSDEYEALRLAPRLRLSSLRFGTSNNWQAALQLVTTAPSDEIIFNEFQRVMQNPNHRYFQLFKAVNRDTDLLLLSSLKALERSLANGRKQRRI